MLRRRLGPELGLAKPVAPPPDSSIQTPTRGAGAEVTGGPAGQWGLGAPGPPSWLCPAGRGRVPQLQWRAPRAQGLGRRKLAGEGTSPGRAGAQAARVGAHSGSQNGSAALGCGSAQGVVESSPADPPPVRGERVTQPLHTGAAAWARGSWVLNTIPRLAPPRTRGRGASVDRCRLFSHRLKPGARGHPVSMLISASAEDYRWVDDSAESRNEGCSRASSHIHFVV